MFQSFQRFSGDFLVAHRPINGNHLRDTSDIPQGNPQVRGMTEADLLVHIWLAATHPKNVSRLENYFTSLLENIEMFYFKSHLQTQIKLMDSQFLMFERALSYSSNMKKSLRSLQATSTGISSDIDVFCPDAMSGEPQKV
jgi:hypothetical protein